MTIVGSTPETGVRIDVSRPREGGPPWRYEGEAVTRDARFALTAVVSAEGQVSVEPGHALAREPGPAGDGGKPEGEGGPGAALPEAVADRIRLLVRAAYKHAREDEQPPPRRIVRWRPEVDVAPPRRGG